MEKEIIESEMLKIKKEFIKSINNYKDHLRFSSMDAPIEVLCLCNRTVNALRKAGITRVSMLADSDLGKVKGLGCSAIGEISVRLKQFLPM